MENGVLILMPDLNLGGAERQFTYLREGLLKKKVKTIVLLTSDNYNHPDDLIYAAGDTQLFFAVRELLLFKRIIGLKKQFNIKTIIVYDKYGHYLCPFLRLTGLKVIFSERNSGHHKNPIGKVCIHTANVITANSEEAVAVMHTYLKNKKVKYIANGIKIPDAEFVKRQDDSRYRICIPARIDYVKNQMLAMKAIRSLENIELHLAGKISNQDYFDDIQTYIKEAGLGSRVIYDGFITDIPNYYKDFDLILLPSLSEGTSNVILEAYAFKKLCLVSDISMNKKIAISDEMVFISNDENDLIKKIVLFSHMADEKRMELKKSGYKFVKNHYCVEKMVEEYYKLI